MYPKVATLIKIKKEADNVLAFVFRYPKLGSRPGQFVMLWLPGVDQKPFSLADDDGKTFTVTVFKIKNFTTSLFALKPGDKVGVTGPFGNPFSWQPRSHIIAAGGGYGSAPLSFLITQAKKNNCSFELLLGAKRQGLLLYSKRFPKYTQIATDDGSVGYHGSVVDLLEQRLTALTAQQKKKTLVCVCGPEMMEYKAAQIAKKHGVQSQISIERYIKCGFGVCGQCCVDDTGEPMCTVGPVVSGKHALSLTEFGKYHRDKSGNKQLYVQC